MAKRRDKYYTWEEFKPIALAMNISSIADYKNKRKVDPKLPSDPQRFYSEMDSWSIFTGRRSKKSAAEFYSWEEFEKIIINKGINSFKKYIEIYKTDDRF